MTAKEVALIARWHAKALELGTRLLAAACFDRNRFVSGDDAIEDDVGSFESLGLELTTEVIDVLHEYCFTLRKLIERTGQKENAREVYPHIDGQTAVVDEGGLDEQRVTLCQKSLWWVLGRVIHSESVVVLGGDRCRLIQYRDGKTREYQDGRCFVEVSSDLDKDGKAHVLHVPSLVGAFASSKMGHEIGEVVRASTLSPR